MAITSYRTRVIVKLHQETEDGAVDFSGKYDLLVKANSIPSPVSEPATVESTTTEDGARTYEMGILGNDMKTISGNLEKERLQRVNNYTGQRVDVMQLYGTQGIGEESKYAYVGQAIAAPNDVGGVDEIVGMSVYVVPNTVPVECTDIYDVADNGDGTFTVTKVNE